MYAQTLKLFPLNSKVQLGSDVDPATAVIILAVLVAFIVFLVIINKMRGGADQSKSSQSGGRSVRYSRWSFRRKASRLGLDNSQIRSLENMGKRFNISPMAMLNSQSAMDKALKLSIRAIEKSQTEEENKEIRKLNLFRIKQILDIKHENAEKITSSRELKPGTHLYLSDASGLKAKTRVHANLKDAISADMPLLINNRPVRWQKDTALKVFVPLGQGFGCFFKSKVLGYNKVRDAVNILLYHSSRIDFARQRKHRRREIEKPAFFYPVTIGTLGVGKKAKKQAFVQNQLKAMGKMLDISPGGCCIQTAKPLKPGSLLKIEFEPVRGMPVNFFGKVLRISKTPRVVGACMHILFTRMTKKNLNRINRFVYEIESE